MRYINLDITTITGPALLCNGVNCQAVMGSGVAKAYFTKWANVRSEYLEAEQSLGNIQPVLVEPADNLYVVNMWTQEFYGRDNRVYASLDAISVCFSRLANYATDVGIHDIYTPRIGCGLGGLQWQYVENVLIDVDRLYPHINITVCDI